MKNKMVLLFIYFILFGCQKQDKEIILPKVPLISINEDYKESIMENLRNRPSVSFRKETQEEKNFRIIQKDDENEFLVAIRNNIRVPQFYSKFLSQQIDFDTRDSDELEIFKIYKLAYDMRASQKSINEEYRIGIFSRHLIEIRQVFKEDISNDDLDVLIALSKALLEGNSNQVLEVLTRFFRQDDFKEQFVQVWKDIRGSENDFIINSYKCDNHLCEMKKFSSVAMVSFMMELEFMKDVEMRLTEEHKIILELNDTIPESLSGIFVRTIIASLGQSKE